MGRAALAGLAGVAVAAAIVNFRPMAVRDVARFAELPWFQRAAAGPRKYW
jgi:hypothetical protein